MTSTDDSLPGLCSTPHRDIHNLRRVIFWSAVWAIVFVAVTLGIKKEWLPFGVAIAGVIATSLFGIAALLAYRRFLLETDELRRKIEVEALALAFGVGVIGGLTYWLLVVDGIMPETGFGFVFGAMILFHPVGVVIGHRKYS